MAAMSGPRPGDSEAQEEVETQMEYFRGNAPRMGYAESGYSVDSSDPIGSMSCVNGRRE